MEDFRRNRTRVGLAQLAREVHPPDDDGFRAGSGQHVPGKSNHGVLNVISLTDSV